MTAARIWAWLLVLMYAALRVKCTGSTTASYEDLLAAVKSGKFEVKKPVRVADSSSQDLLQEILEKSKILYCRQSLLKIEHSVIVVKI